MDTYITTCSVCEEEMDMIAGTGKKPVCDDCMTADEAEKEKWDNYHDDLIACNN